MHIYPLIPNKQNKRVPQIRHQNLRGYYKGEDNQFGILRQPPQQDVNPQTIIDPADISNSRGAHAINATDPLRETDQVKKISMTLTY